MDDFNKTKQTEFDFALDFINQELGKGFIKTCNINHPIRRMISNKANWQIQELIRFTKTLKVLKSTDSNYKKLIAKILPLKESMIEGIPFVEIVGNFINADFQVHFLDEKNASRTPDIEIRNSETNETFFVEVSVVNNRDENKFISNNYDFLTHLFQFVLPFYPYTGKQKDKISIEKYDEIQKIISEAKIQVDLIQNLVSYSDNRFEFTLAPYDKIADLDKICNQNGTRRNDISSLPVSFNETERIISKLSNKKGQIYSESNGIIYLKMNPMFFLTLDIENFVKRLQGNIAQYSNLLGIVLYSKILDSNEGIFFEFEKNVFSQKIYDEVLCRNLLFVFNENCTVKLSTETVQKIYNSFKY